MLSGVASLLFGSSTEPEKEIPEVDVPTRDAELGWVYVDLPANEKSSNENEQQQQQQDGESAPSHRCELRVPVEIPEGDSSCPSDPESTGSSSHPPTSPGCCCAPHPGAPGLCDRNVPSVESWVLTPPPCFTGRRKRNSGVEDSPMENLLIEHPSMSVYNSYGGDSTGENSNQSESSSDVEMEDMAVAHRTRQQVQHQAPRRPHAVAARAGIVAHIENVKYAQRKQQSHSNKHLNKKSIEKSNRVKAYESMGKRQSKQNRSLRPSGRMNGRMPQRKF